MKEKYEVVMNFVDYLGNVYDSRIIGIFESIEWAEGFLEIAVKRNKKQVEKGLIKIWVKTNEELA